jgi:beta-galactosidase
MRQAGVNTVSLAIFSWGRIQPSEHEWDFDWLDCVIDKLGRGGIAVDLASATATAPMWLYESHPEVLPVESNGDIVNPGSRQSWRPTSPVFKRYALQLCSRLAERYRDNPYVTAWHINNEYGWNNRYDYSDDALKAFRIWCRQRYGSIDALNEAWGTAFWAQQVHSFEEVILPKHMGSDAMVNPSQQLDFERFGSDALKDFYKSERDTIERICPDKPCTTNFMVSTEQCSMDYADWSDEVDFVSNDHYFTAGRSHLDELLCSDALVDSLALGKPWYVMEHSTSAVQWKPLNSRKRAGELIRDAVAHVAMGADAINYFQWRQSSAGAEAFHSSMLPHAGADSKIFREVCELGEALKTLADAGLQGSVLEESHAAILFDADCEWATRCQTLPSTSLSHWHDVRTWYQAFLDSSSRADVVPLRADWTGYDTIVMPTMLLLSRQEADRIASFVHGGGRLVASYATGLADDRFHVALGGYPGLLRETLGVRGEEFNILGKLEGDPDDVGLSNGFTSRLWENVVTSVAQTARVLATYSGDAAVDWELDEVPAIVRNRYGAGSAYYIGCDLGRSDIAGFVDTELHDLVTAADNRVVHTRRRGAQADFDFYFNRSKDKATIHDVPGEAVFLYRADAVDSSAVYALDRSGVVVTASSR